MATFFARGVLAGCAALAACAGAEAMTLPVQPTAAQPGTSTELGLNPGESMAFEVKLGGVLAGEAQLAVGEIGIVDGHKRVVVKSRAATAGAVAIVKHIVDEMTTEIDVLTGHPVAFETLVEVGSKRTTASGTFTGSKADVTYSRTETADKPQKYVIDFGKVEVHDAHSAMAQLRGWRPAIGGTRTLYLVGGRRLWRVDMKYVGTETIGSALGNRPVVKFEGKSFRARGNLTVESARPARTFTVYLSDDADRVPLRVIGATELGDIVMELTEYNRP